MRLFSNLNPIFAFVLVGIFPLLLVILGLMIAFFLVPVLTMTKSMREGIEYDEFKPLRGITPFLIATIAISTLLVFQLVLPVLITSLTLFSSSPLNSFAMPMGRIILGQLATISVFTGFVLCIVVLWKFNRSLREVPPLGR